MRITERASSSGSPFHPQSPGCDECHGRHHPSGTSPHAPTTAVPFKPVVHVHTTLVLPNLSKLQVPGTSSMVDRHSQYSPRKKSSFTYRDWDTVHGQFSDRMGGIPERSPPGPQGVGPGDFIQKEHQLARSSHRSSPRSLPSNVGTQISYDPHGQHSVRIQPEERGQNALSGAVLHSLGHSHKMSPHPPSCPTSDGDDERSSDKLSRANKAIPTEWCIDNSVFRAVTNQLGEPGFDLFATCLNKKLPVYVSPCPDPQTLAIDAEHGLELSSPGIRISSDANSPQSASENQDLISHHHSDSASLANSILVPGSPQTPYTIPVFLELLSQVVGCQTWFHKNPGTYHYRAWTLSGIRSWIKDFQSRLPKEFRDHKGTLPDWYMRERVLLLVPSKAE